MDEKKPTLIEGPVDRTLESEQLIARVRRLEQEVAKLKGARPDGELTYLEEAERQGFTNQRTIEVAVDELRQIFTTPGLGAFVGSVQLRKAHEFLDGILVAYAREKG